MKPKPICFGAPSGLHRILLLPLSLYGFLVIILLWVLGFFFLFFLFFVPLFLSIFSLFFTRNRGISLDLEESAAALGGFHGLLSHPPLIANATPHLTVSASFVAHGWKFDDVSNLKPKVRFLCEILGFWRSIYFWVCFIFVYTNWVLVGFYPSMLWLSWLSWLQ